MSEEQNYYFTFMLRQEELKDKYVKVFGTYNEARAKMVNNFGIEWAFQYTEKEFLPQIEMFGLTELKIEGEEDG